ncbi:MAG: flippase-like domain-containing protein [Nitrospirae bacterium]|nr:flippase-like domain-containing protein [Nitrospirota bacterium]
MKKLMGSIIKACISLIFFLALLWIMRNEIDDALRAIKSTNLLIFAAGFLLYIISTLILAIRLRGILDVQSIRVSLPEALLFTFIGYFFNNFLPSAVGGDAVKAYYISKKTNRTLESVTSVLLDRLIGMFSFNKNLAKKFNFILTPFKMLKLDSKVKKLYDAMHGYMNHRGGMLQSFYLSIIAQVMTISIIYLLGLSISVNISFLMLFLIMPIIFTVSILPSLNGLGVREAGFVYFLKGMAGADKALAISLLWLATTLLGSFIGGLGYALRGQLKIEGQNINW